MFCITIDEWTACGMSYELYVSDKKRGYLKVARTGGNGRKALIEFDSIAKLERKNAILNMYGDPRQKAASGTLRERIKPDAKALEFYSNFQLSDGRSLPEKNIREYCQNASVLNAVHEILSEAKVARRAAGYGDSKHFFIKAAVTITSLAEEFAHTLPHNHRHIQRVYNKYITEGYYGLISGKFCNDNSRKVSNDIEHLIMSIYAMDNKPFAASVHELYNSFVQGKIDVVDRRTGELFDRNLFIKKGAPIELSDSTIWNYLNNPKNRAIVDKARSGQFQYNNTHRPHHHRHSPFFSFSKISLDDRDLPRKLTDGKRLKAYYSYDVTSGCVIGYAHSRDKDEKLFLDCLRNMFQLIERNNFGMPMEAEVEHHLVNKFFDDLALMFPFLRICNPGNSQEKRAEHFNKAKKYSVEKGMHKDIGRWWARCEAYRIDVDKVDNEFKEKGYTLERLVADDIESIKQYNNQLHPRQKVYPGKTRWQVLQENMNPALAQVNKAILYKTIGHKTETTINRNQYVTVQHEKYQLPSPQIIERLMPNNYCTDAYYLADDNGQIPAVYLYQNGTYICKCEKIVAYNESKAEQTADDAMNYESQSKYVSSFDKMTKDGKKALAKPVIINIEEINAIVETAVQTVAVVDTNFIKEDDINELLAEYDPEEYKGKAQVSI
ncbi:MAG TPA: hypothetical protein PKI01_12195 [Bacteroidales bacterium]|nr:hypothetical protein [Bacteroidales bacterium]